MPSDYQLIVQLRDHATMLEGKIDALEAMVRDLCRICIDHEVRLAGDTCDCDKPLTGDWYLNDGRS
jgi:hypothetical protein